MLQMNFANILPFDNYHTKRSLNTRTFFYRVTQDQITFKISANEGSKKLTRFASGYADWLRDEIS